MAYISPSHLWGATLNTYFPFISILITLSTYIMAEAKRINTHTIVLAQFTAKGASRQWSDFESIESAMDGIHYYPTICY